MTLAWVHFERERWSTESVSVNEARSAQYFFFFCLKCIHKLSFVLARLLFFFLPASFERISAVTHVGI